MEGGQAVSDTPRTDAANTYIRTRRDFTITDHQVWQEHGEHLERELNEANKRIKRLEKALERLFNLPNDCCCQLSDESLDAWKNAHESLKAKEAKP